MTSRLLSLSRARWGLLVTFAAWSTAAAAAQGLSESPRASEAASAQSADYIVAVVNSEPITNNEVRARLAQIEQQMGRAGGPRPPHDELARQVLERLISEKAQLQYARESGMRVEAAAIDQAELSVAQQNQLDREGLHRRLAQDGIPLDRFRDDLRNQLLLSRLREREIAPRVKVTDAEADRYLREQLAAKAIGSTEINLAMVLVVVPEDSTPAQVAALQARAQRAADRARAGEDFGALVQEYSSVRRGPDDKGELGLRSTDRYPPLFVEATQTLRPGQIAGPIRSAAGFHVLKLVDKRQSSQLTVTQTRARHILLRPDAKLSEAAAMAQLADYKRRVESGSADFAALARQYSKDGSARAGGDLGWTSPGQFVPEFEDVMNRLAIGQISDPLISRFGVHLIQVVDRRERVLNAEEQRELARNALREKKQEEAFATWAQEVRGRAWVEYRDPPQ